VLNTLFGYACFAFFLYAGFGHRWGSLGATALGILFNFMTSRHLVFEVANGQSAVRFFLVYVVVYIINLAALEVFVWWGVSAYWAGLLLVLPCAGIAYLLQKNFVFNNDQAN